MHGREASQGCSRLPHTILKDKATVLHDGRCHIAAALRIASKRASPMSNPAQNHACDGV